MQREKPLGESKRHSVRARTVRRARKARACSSSWQSELEWFVPLSGQPLPHPSSPSCRERQLTDVYEGGGGKRYHSEVGAVNGESERVSGAQPGRRLYEESRRGERAMCAAQRRRGSGSVLMVHVRHSCSNSCLTLHQIHASFNNYTTFSRVCQIKNARKGDIEMILADLRVFCQVFKTKCPLSRIFFQQNPSQVGETSWSQCGKKRRALP